MSASDALPDMSRALVYEPSTASFLVAGLGGRLGGRKVGTQSKKAGSIVSLSSKTLRVMCELSVAKEQISDLRFTSDGGTLCVGSNDNLIYLVAGQIQEKKIHRIQILIFIDLAILKYFLSLDLDLKWI